MTRTILLSLPFLISAVVVPVQAQEVLTIGPGTYVLHPDPSFDAFGKKIILDEVYEEDPGHDIKMIIELSGISPNPFIVRRSINLKNAFAVVHGSEKYIVYDPGFGGRDGGSREFVFAHELGHHVCGHTFTTIHADPWVSELEADRYAGAALRRANKPLNPEIEAARKFLPPAGSKSHPPLALRIKAITEGYRSGSTCDQRGFVKPAEYTKEERARMAKGVDEFCQQVAREFCSANDLDTKLHRYGLVTGNCEVKPEPGPIVFRDPKTWKRIVVLPGVDCAGGGRYKREGISTHLHPD